MAYCSRTLYCDCIELAKPLVLPMDRTGGPEDASSMRAITWISVLKTLIGNALLSMSDYVPNVNSELLSHLTNDEKAKIVNVIEQDKELMQNERIRLE